VRSFIVPIAAQQGESSLKIAYSITAGKKQ